ncbi:roadblock/LC7 domain-containing protein [candidate division WOR-3 bacterium]|nr:roadblock/LC7 domain-containing protein [candidate division WOR-3 bacterium]
MNFKKLSDLELLEHVVSEVKGAVAAGLISMDGLSMGVYNTMPGFDTKAADAEFATILRATRKALRNLGPNMGGLEEVIVGAENGIIIVRMIGDDYYTGIALKKNGNIAMARLMQKKLVLEMHLRYYDKEMDSMDESA